MRQESMSSRDTAERTVRDIRRKTRKQYSAEEKIWIEKRRPKLDLAAYPHLPVARVTTTSASSYMSLLSGEPA